LGALVSIIDSAVDGCGANEYNIAPIRGAAQLIPLDIAEADKFADVIREADLIFNLAGEISHAESMRLPERDMALNAVAHLRFLQTCRRVRPGIRVVYAGTRQVYGRPEYLPVNEVHRLQAVDFNAIHKLAGAQYHLLLSSRGEIDAAVLRLTNVYGPRMALRLPWQGFLGCFFRSVLEGEPLRVYGDGMQLRDPLYVDDAVRAFLMAGAAERLPSRIYNVGGPEALPLSRIAELMSGASPACVPFPDGRKAIDIGSYWTDWSCIRRELGWEPAVPFTEGAFRTLEYYRRRLGHYIDAVPAKGALRTSDAKPAEAPAAR
jgi:nucleoside-diphosphate-sugar epimerase